MAHILGIDLGTTNSVVAIIEGGEPIVIPNAKGQAHAVGGGHVQAGERLVGQVARRQAVTNPENTIFSIKRFMGRKFNDPEVQRDIKLVPYTVTEATNGDVQVKMGGKAYSPPEVSAMILQKLKADAEAYLGEKVDAGRDHRPGLLQRLAAPGDQGRGRDRRPRSAAHHQRADRVGPGLWPRQEDRGEDRGLRPRRRHLRHLDPRSRPRASSR